MTAKDVVTLVGLAQSNERISGLLRNLARGPEAVAAE